jgi:hypothetical protein
VESVVGVVATNENVGRESAELSKNCQGVEETTAMETVPVEFSVTVCCIEGDSRVILVSRIARCSRETRSREEEWSSGSKQLSDAGTGRAVRDAHPSHTPSFRTHSPCRSFIPEHGTQPKLTAIEYIKSSMHRYASNGRFQHALSCCIATYISEGPWLSDHLTRAMRS